MTEMHPAFTAAVADLSERHRDEVLAAYAALEHSWQPLHESQLLALRDATLRRSLQQLLHPLGRTLVKVGPHNWTSGYRDDISRELSAEMLDSLPLVDRAVFVLILIHSVAIPRSQGLVDLDSWISNQPTTAEELTRYSKLPRTAVRAGLARLRASGLVQLAPDRRPNSQKAGSSSSAGASYLPGPQLARLTPAARRLLQEELILAAGADTPLAAAIRARRARPSEDGIPKPAEAHTDVPPQPAAEPPAATDVSSSAASTSTGTQPPTRADASFASENSVPQENS
ncbi:hypothetical protein [Kineosporia babensis]|uniref:Uncharacterized protein n=1 Tax=Kineosporia babensis TaxID=499548 RepID=A0A9X1NES2_9ACTN|nr:hypothetical protein [Kineosporia babensis]MCD5312364.1 hypothetical protein [Kineosporia babensis]